MTLSSHNVSVHHDLCLITRLVQRCETRLDASLVAPKLTVEFFVSDDQTFVLSFEDARGRRLRMAFYVIFIMVYVGQVSALEDPRAELKRHQSYEREKTHEPTLEKLWRHVLVHFTKTPHDH